MSVHKAWVGHRFHRCQACGYRYHRGSRYLTRSDLTSNGQIVADTTLITELPQSLKKFIGSKGDTEQVMVGMDLKFKADKE